MVLEQSNNPLLIGSQHIRLKRVNSTNNYALETISKSKPIEGTVISASYQDKGRGQIGRYWESEKGKNITCSTILYPKFLLAHNQFQLNMAVSLAIFDLIEHYITDSNHKIKIKWPNDIYINDEKIAGILIQNSLKGKSISSSIIGTGININQQVFSKDIPNATSLINLLKTEVDIESTFLWLFRFLTKRYLQLSSGHINQLKNEYLDNLYRKDLWSTFQDEKDLIFKGKIKGVDEIGQLTIMLENDSLRSFAFREVKFVI